MNILKYTLKLLLLLSSIYAWGQAEEPKDTIVEKLRPEPFVRVGFDLSAIGRNIMEREVQQYEISFDSEIYHNWFLNLEGGILNVASDNPDFEYSSNGWFVRTGMDFNLLKRQEKTQNDVVLVGVRYSFSSLSHESPRYNISSIYWGGSEQSGFIDKSSYLLHWFELSGGVTTEVFKNIFLSWSLRTRVRITGTQEPELNPYYIGGFGQGKRRAPVMIHFSIKYRFGI